MFREGQFAGRGLLQCVDPDDTLLRVSLELAPDDFVNHFQRIRHGDSFVVRHHTQSFNAHCATVPSGRHAPQLTRRVVVQIRTGPEAWRAVWAG
jgi:hypothetical protein